MPVAASLTAVVHVFRPPARRRGQTRLRGIGPGELRAGPPTHAHNGHFETVCYHPLFPFNGHGDCLAAKLRPGNVSSADDWEELLVPEVDRQQAMGQRVAFRADAAFARPEIYEALEARGVGYAIRIPANKNLELAIEAILFRSPGRPSRKPLVRYKSFQYHADSWTAPRRVVAKVEAPRERAELQLRNVERDRGAHSRRGRRACALRVEESSTGPDAPMKESKRMKHLSIALVSASLMSACGGSSPGAPTALPAPTRPTSTLSGLVFAIAPTGLAPVAGARVRLEIGTFRVDATTDQSGRYTMTGLYEGSSTITTSRDGYDPDTRKVAISGDVRLDIGVVPRVAHTVSGSVFEMTSSGRVPVEGVYVTGSWDYPVTTDGNGSFSLSVCGASPCSFYNGDRLNVFVSKDGYQPDRKDVTIDGDVRLDFQLVRR